MRRGQILEVDGEKAVVQVLHPSDNFLGFCGAYKSLALHQDNAMSSALIIGSLINLICI
jgi:hypothetical protein